MIDRFDLLHESRDYALFVVVLLFNSIKCFLSLINCTIHSSTIFDSQFHGEIETIKNYLDLVAVLVSILYESCRIGRIVERIFLN